MAPLQDDCFLVALEAAMRAEFSSPPQHHTPDTIRDALDNIEEPMESITTSQDYLSRTVPGVVNGLSLLSSNSFWDKAKAALDPARDPAMRLSDFNSVTGGLSSILNTSTSFTNTHPAHESPGIGSIFHSMYANVEKLHAAKNARRAETSLAHLEPFSYDALPSGTSIRLLRLEHIDQESGILKLTVHVVDLNDSPQFNALSYVWGDHRPRLHQSYHPNRAWRKVSVMCNGCCLDVTYSLFLALQELQKRLRVSPMNDIWIDQVCINQEDLLERGSQVAIMGDIYQSADKVLSWLGPEDRYTEEALQFLGKLATIPEKSYGKIAHDIGPFILEQPSTSWESLSSLLSRPYFNRAWVVQEVVSAKNLTMICGSRDFAWGDLVQASKFLQNTKPWALLTDHAARFDPVEDRLDPKKSGMPLGMPLEYGSQLSSLIEVKSRMTDPRIPWQELLFIGRKFGATVPQDKHYAMLGLLKERLSSTVLSVDLPCVDYSKPVDEVTLQFSHLYLDATQNLNLLNYLEDVEYRTSKDLPSWVPDSQSRLLPTPLDYTSLDNMTDATSTKSCFSLDSTGRILHVQGTQLDIITETSASFNEIQDTQNWLSILKLLKSITTSKTSSTPTDEIFIRTLLTMPYNSKSQNSSLSVISLDFGAWMIKNLSLIGRGATANYTGSNGVSDLVSLYYARIDDTLSDITTFGEYQRGDIRSEPATKLFLKGMDAFNSEFQGDMGKFGLLEDTKQAMEELWNLNRTGAFPSPSKVKETLNVLDKFKEESPGREAIERQVESFQARLGLRLYSRRMFVTKSGRLGLGPRSLQVGDEIYGLRAAGMPFVLRRREEGGDQVVGHSFILDLLKSETLKDNLELQDIFLV